MPRTKSFILATLCAVIGVAGVAVPAAQAHGAMSETYTAEAPTPSTNQCRTAPEGVGRESHAFQLPVSGTLSVTMTEFTGDWDLYLLDSTGTTLASSTGEQVPGPEAQVEELSAVIGADDAVSIVACNWAGGASATVSFTFVPAPLVSVGDVTVHEGDAGTRNAVFSVTLNAASDSTVTVDYATADGTGVAPDDYTSTSGTVTFPPGTTNATVQVPVTGDKVQEGPENYWLFLSEATGAVVADGAGVGTVTDDDPSTGRRLAIGDVRVHEGESGARSAVFTVSLSKPSTSTVAVAYAVNRTASTSTSDLKTKSGTLTFPAGTLSQTVKVSIVPDALSEIDESFYIRLSAASGATITDNIGVGIIIDDD